MCNSGTIQRISRICAKLCPNLILVPFRHNVTPDLYKAKDEMLLFLHEAAYRNKTWHITQLTNSME